MESVEVGVEAEDHLLAISQPEGEMLPLTFLGLAIPLVTTFRRFHRIFLQCNGWSTNWGLRKIRIN